MLKTCPSQYATIAALGVGKKLELQFLVAVREFPTNWVVKNFFPLSNPKKASVAYFIVFSNTEIACKRFYSLLVYYLVSDNTSFLGAFGVLAVAYVGII